MVNMFASAFADLAQAYRQSTPDEVLAIFIRRFGPTWATDVTMYVAEDVIKRNRPEYHKFYFDSGLPLSMRLDPRSGMFFRKPKSEAGKIEILLHLALGFEGLAQLLKVPRAIDGSKMCVTVANKSIDADRSSFESDFAQVLKSASSQSQTWDDELLLPSYEDALFKARDALLKLQKAKSYDEEALFNLMNVMRCGAHCQMHHMITVNAGHEMAKIMAIGGAIRSAANKVTASLNR